MPKPDQPETISLATLDGAIQLWRGIVGGFAAAGYSTVLPEYLRLSQMLSQTRMTGMLRGSPETQDWQELRRLGTEALLQITPLIEAARILAELPGEMTVSASVATGSPAPALSETPPSTPVRRSAPRAQRKKPAAKSAVPGSTKPPAARSKIVRKRS